MDTTKAETMISGLVPKKGGNYGTCKGYVGISTRFFNAPFPLLFSSSSSSSLIIIYTLMIILIFQQHHHHHPLRLLCPFFSYHWTTHRDRRALLLLDFPTSDECNMFSLFKFDGRIEVIANKGSTPWVESFEESLL